MENDALLEGLADWKKNPRPYVTTQTIEKVKIKTNLLKNSKKLVFNNFELKNLC